MIDPANITNFNRTDAELEELTIFSVLVAGKTSKTIAPRSNLLVQEGYKYGEMFKLYPLTIYLRGFNHTDLSNKLKGLGIAPYNQKARTLIELADRINFNRIDLRTCSFDALETVWGISYKTSRMIIVHSRPNVRTVVPDTHIRKGINLFFPGEPLPDHPPKNKKEFQRWENRFLYLCDKMDKTCAELDLEWWRKFSGNN